MLLVTPTWHTQPWYLSLLQMSIETPLIHPMINSLFKDPIGKELPLITNKTLKLAAWKISGRDYLCQPFQEQLPVLLLTQGQFDLQETIYLFIFTLFAVDLKLLVYTEKPLYSFYSNDIGLTDVNSVIEQEMQSFPKESLKSM